MKTMYEQNLEKILAALGDIELTPEERHSLEWLCTNEPGTVNNICNIIIKVKIAN